MRETRICSMCGEPFPEERLREVEGARYCPGCLETETAVCSHCGRRIRIGSNMGDENRPLCPDCFHDYYTRCIHCDALIRAEEACYEDDCQEEPCCSECYGRYDTGAGPAIHEYYYKPAPLFYGKGTRFFGVELEVDDAGESDENAETVMRLANRDGIRRVYCKHDGSLDDGFEIVTHPMTLDYHCTEMPWREVLDELRDMGYLSHKADTCGLHIHVNRSTFGKSVPEQDACMARILYFFEKHWEELLKFSRRTEYQLSRWAARYGYKEHPMEILDHAKKGRGNGHYACINLQNADTVEFRIFRGTLKYNTLIAALQLVEQVCNAAFSLSDREMRSLSWTSFAAGCSRPELMQYLKERRLYVNDPVSTEEEW